MWAGVSKLKQGAYKKGRIRKFLIWAERQIAKSSELVTLRYWRAICSLRARFSFFKFRRQLILSDEIDDLARNAGVEEDPNTGCCKRIDQNP